VGAVYPVEQEQDASVASLERLNRCAGWFGPRLVT
jgi:hypothetical protein